MSIQARTVQDNSQDFNLIEDFTKLDLNARGDEIIYTYVSLNLKMNERLEYLDFQSPNFRETLVPLCLKRDAFHLKLSQVKDE
jgi:hypothetical protein